MIIPIISVRHPLTTISDIMFLVVKRSAALEFSREPNTYFVRQDRAFCQYPTKLLSESQPPLMAKGRSKVNSVGTSQRSYGVKSYVLCVLKYRQHLSGVRAFHLSASTGEKLFTSRSFHLVFK